MQGGRVRDKKRRKMMTMIEVAPQNREAFDDDKVCMGEVQKPRLVLYNAHPKS